MPGESADAGELAVVLTSIDAQFKASMKEATAALDRVADKVVQIPSAPLEGAGAALRGVGKAGEAAEGGVGGVVEKFGHMGRALSHINPELGHMAKLTHALELLANPVALLGVAFAAAAFGVYKLVEANAELDKKMSSFEDDLAKSDAAIASSTEGWKAYYSAIISGATEAEAARKQLLASGQAGFTKEQEEIAKQVADYKKKLDEQIAIKAHADSVLNGTNGFSFREALNTEGITDSERMKKMAVDSAAAGQHIAFFRQQIDNANRSLKGEAKELGDVTVVTKEMEAAEQALLKNDLAGFFSRVDDSTDSLKGALDRATNAEKIAREELTKWVEIHKTKAPDALYEHVVALHAHSEAVRFDQEQQKAARTEMEKTLATMKTMAKAAAALEIAEMFVIPDSSLSESEAKLAALRKEAEEAQRSYEKLLNEGLMKRGDSLWEEATRAAKHYKEAIEDALQRAEELSRLGPGQFNLATGSNEYGDLAKRPYVGETAAAAGMASIAHAGKLGNVISGAQQGSAAGPWGAAAGALIALATSSKGFQEVLEKLDPIIQALADTVGTLLKDALMPFIPVVKILLDTFRPLIAALEPLVRVLYTISPPLLILGAVARTLNWAMKGLFEAIKAVSLGILKAIKWLADRLGIHIGGLNAAISDLQDTTFDSANNVDALGKAAADAAGALTNLPQGFKYALRKYQSETASDNGPGSGGGGGGGGGPVGGLGNGTGNVADLGADGAQTQSFHRGAGGGVKIYGDLVLHGVQNVSELHRELKRLGKRSTIRTNGFLPDGA